MKTYTLKTVVGSLLIAGTFVMAPMAAFAATATTSSSVRINGDGIVKVTNAEVTSISGNIINAVTRFKNTVVNWAFTTNASTTIAANNSLSASTTDVHVGDKLKVNGALTAFGSTVSVVANKLLDITSMASWRAKTGTVQTINLTNGTFVLKSGDKLITVQTNASTTFALSPKATSTATTTTFASLAINARVAIVGSMNADGTVLTATKVTLLPAEHADSKEKKDKKDNHGSDKGLKNGWKDKEDRDNSGEHKGFLGATLGLGLDD